MTRLRHRPLCEANRGFLAEQHSVVSEGRRYLAILFPALVVAYAVILRFDALTRSYGPVTSPAWLHLLQADSTAPLRVLRPKTVHWEPVPNYPHRDGRPSHYISDPYTYLEFGRGMRSFYAAHYREPLFPFVTKQYLRLLNDQDVAVSFASASFSILVVIGTYLLGSYAFSRWAGMGAALAMAIEYDVITWGIGGWRDDAFTLSVVMFAYTLLRYSREPSKGRAIVMGACAGLACLVRITSWSFLLPGFIYLLATTARPWKDRLRDVSLAILTMTIIVGPYLFNCWRVFGDPLYAINYHADNYLKAEGNVSDSRPNAFAYVRSKAVSRPFQTLDTAVLGVTTYPFQNKWHGFDPWMPGLGQTLSWAALAGLLLCVGSAPGRLLLLINLSSLVPYAVTWKLASDWRFTEHAYPFFLIAAAMAVTRVVAVAARRPVRGPIRDLLPARRAIAFWAMVLGAVALGCWTVLRLFPVWTMREALLANEQATIMSGDRDGAFFGADWSEPRTSGNVTARTSQGPQAVVWLPLPRVDDYDLTVRIDPFPRPPANDPASWPTLQVAVNDAVLGNLPLRESPGRIGSYDVHLARALVKKGFNRLTLTAKSSRISTAGPTSEVVRDDRARLDLWYVRIRPRNSSVPTRAALESTPQYTGQVDAATCVAIAGWVADLGHLAAPVDVDFFDGTSLLGRVTASDFRRDLVNAGIGDGHHAYTFVPPASVKDGAMHVIDVRVTGTTTSLARSPARLTCPPGN